MDDDTVVRMLVTPEIAKQWIVDRAYTGQRKLRKSHVTMLAKEMTKGTFLSFTTIGFVKHQNGRTELIDGQHRLHAVVSSGMPQEFAIVTRSVETEDEVADIYGYTDIGRRRAPRDYFSALKLDERYDIPPSFISCFAPAVSFINQGCVGASADWKKIPRDQQVGLMDLYAPYAKTYYTYTLSAPRGVINRALFRSHVVALGLLTLRFSTQSVGRFGERTVERFWDGVIRNDMIAANDPRRHANTHLLTTYMANGGMRNMKARQITSAYGIRFLAVCFNLYMAGETRKQQIKVDELSALNIRGVPSDIDAWKI